ncbi:MAG: homocysteine S-methyltransferase family protein, partial [Deferribacterota bacterium]|nr:homocysteine S-methyltransferase family protein [Deferribacterota bacterium]
MHFENLLNSDKIILFDGAMGTSLQNINIPNGIDEKYQGCNEYLNIFAPEIIYDIHKSFLDAGADVIETNTFGANKVILSEYSLEKECYKINFEAVKIAKEAANKYGKFVAASIGPTNKLPSLKQITFDELQDAYRPQIEAFIDASADLILIETAQDLLQVKAALFATFTTLKKHNSNIYVMLSVSLQDNGYMLLGSNIDAIVSLAECFPIISLGFNCSFGPDKMISPLNELNNKWSRLISVIPNAGLPKNVDGKLVYDLSSKDFAKIIESLCDKSFVDIVGGCCGTTPEYIKELNSIIEQYKRRGIKKIPYIGKGSSLFNISTLRQEPPPAIIAERGNVNGSKIFRNLLLNDDYDSMLQFLKKEEDYAHFLDISVAYPGRNEIDDLEKIVSLANKNIIKPICIDSTNPDAIETALKSYAGKPIINSVHFEDGGDKLKKVFEIIRYLPAVMIGLCIDEEGMALKADKKLSIAKRIYDKWVNFYGYKSEDLIIDPLTFSIGAGDKSLRFAGVETLNALKLIKKELPAVNTILGVSNISFGLSKNSRPYLNSIFLKEAIDAGLDMAIIDPKKIIPIANIDDEKRRLCLDLIYGEENSLTNFIKYFSDNAGYFDTKISKNMSDEELIKEKILKGDKIDIEKILQRLLEKYAAIEIINNILLEAMKEVGRLFGEGKILLPFVLESAETMKMSIKYLEPYLEKKKEQKKGTILLATVKGDVHDIGKNLVDIILSNNGYEVHNLGIKVPVEEMCKKYREIKPDAIGMSGL